VQVANVMSTGMEWNVLRIGAMTFLSVGQLLPHQLANFHTEDFIYPIGENFSHVFLSFAATIGYCWVVLTKFIDLGSVKYQRARGTKVPRSL
jgi:hypothetical protein